MPVVKCPTEAELKSYLLGLLSEIEINQVTRHLDGCPPCEETVGHLEQQSDTLVSGLRQTNKVPPPDNHELQRAMAIVRQVGHGASVAAQGLAIANTLPLGNLREYELLEKRGQGGMGAVYKARHTKLDKVVAVKVLPPDRTSNPQARARFEREMKAVGKLDHPNIVRAMDAGEFHGVHFLVMEYVSGCTLSELVSRRGPLAVSEACEIIRQAAVGLQEAYEHGMVHRDIKPSNLMLARSRKGPPVVKILDLGLALLDSAPQDRELTGTGQMMGTLNYMAPEQGLDSHEVDIRADLYALGATLFKLLTGETPFSQDKLASPLKVMLAVTSQPAPLLSDYREDAPAELVQIVSRLLAKSVEDRPADPQELVALLTPFAAGARLSTLLQKVGNECEKSTRVTPSLLQPTTSVAPGAGRPQQVPAAADGQPTHSARRRAWLPIVLIGGALAAIVGFAAIFSLRTPAGMLTVEVADDYARQVQIVATGDGSQVVISKDKGWQVELKDGEYHLALLGGDDQLALDQDTVEIRRGGEVKVTVRRTVKTSASVPAVAPTTTSVGVAPQGRQFTNSIGTTFVRVPRGTFWISVSGRNAQKEVVVAHDYYLGQYEITQREWETVMGSNPSSFSRGGVYADRVKHVSDEDLQQFPVEYVSIADVNRFIQRLNQLESQPEWIYRLPTATEWEYACRGASSSKEVCSYDYYFAKPTNHISHFEANIDGPLMSGRVGKYQPNALGIYDMHGNVAEWTDSGLGWGTIVRGGSSVNEAFATAGLESVSSKERRSNRGFRLVIAPRQPLNAEQTHPPLKRPFVPLEPLPEIEPQRPRTAAGEVFSNSIGMKFVHVPMNIFWISASGKNAQQQVEIPYDYQIGMYEVTQHQWRQIMEDDPSYYAPSGEGNAALDGLTEAAAARLPVHSVTLAEATEFADRLSKQEAEVGWTYRLPSHEEWEFACRAGATSQADGSYDYYLQSPGNELTNEQACFGGEGPPQPVGSYPPNVLGIYDMHGNVAERVASGMGFGRFFLGGGWSDPPEACRAASRPIMHEDKTENHIGLRLVRVRKPD